MERENQEYISIVNATENNLKHVSLKIPKKKITVFTGVSGSGKSSLCLDTIAAESRRELNVTFPSFVQQFLPKYGRPEVERMENLPGHDRDRSEKAGGKLPLNGRHIHRYLCAAAPALLTCGQTVCRLFGQLFLQPSERQV